VAGPIGISEKAIASAPPNMQFLGRITRDQTQNLYREADVFVLPTVSDGFAITQLEAMAHAVPVIATPNCGDVVTDGVDGRLVAAHDGSALAEAIGRMNEDREGLVAMSVMALLKSRQFGLRRFAELVNEAMNRFGAPESDLAMPGP
jgi:glycosyltransferase involved in cell wall biosynthesis